MLEDVPAKRDDRLLTSRQAADRLGVKLETLYAYVARGLLRAESGPRAGRNGGGGRGYSPNELDSFQARRRWSRRVVASAVSSTDGGRLLYRGRDAVALADRARFEGVAALLWTGATGDAGDWPGVGRDEIETAARAARMVPRERPLLQAQTAVALLAAADEGPSTTEASGVAATGRRLVTRLVAALARARGVTSADASRGPMATRVLAALGVRPTAASARMCERALILSSEHELNASTFAARVAASTGADLHAVVSAGLATLSGPKHGGMTDRVEALFRGGAARASDALLGFGHPLYPDGDPRTPPLLEAIRAPAGPARPEIASLLAVVDAMEARRSPRPTVDVGLVATAMSLGLAPGLASTLFAFGRTSGWIAHAIEQYAMGELIRPRARYVGPREGEPG
jgi:citrate synthase